jgi:multiple sugar transport system ATP-binding protein
VEAKFSGRRAASHHPAKPFIARVDGRRPPAKGETVYFRPKEGHLHLFDAKSGKRLGD